MHRTSIFKWITLSIIAASITVFLLELRNQDLVHAALTQTESGTEGSLLAIDSKGNPAGACPLKHTSVHAEISGFLSRVTVTQEFENPFADKIEAFYTFPLPQAAAVDDMTMKVGERTIKGKIMRREEAKATYTAAKANGQVASLLDQERPNIFTQSVANIMPGEKITVTINYVETLKYEDGSYEFSFPMVVGPRYIPGHSAEEAQGSEQADAPAAATTAERVPDAARITPPSMPEGMRAGHDISIEIALDAGVPIEGLKSSTHAIEVETSDDRRARVRLKDQQTIPNKDFILKYDVAGSRIEDAVLTHRTGRDGFFTLILQPPERVTFEDVMPKELVFVLDTSGSMQGFPIEKAKETMKLALDHLYPQDTFNLITFSGDTNILFDQPVPATVENRRKAQKFLEEQRGGGGTEMMKAIVAALDPSDAQDHLRIACFMTDGQVGNDQEIISEVLKHKNARVFAMGFGSGPNRFLLDKMAEYGRGEVEYVTEESDGSLAARRFFERVRSPLLTDITVDYAGLSISDVYPKRIPDLFSAKPVILSGRYAASGRGTIRLKGRMSGRDVVREIPVELPELAPEHDVLATLWARRRVDELMGQEMSGAAETGKPLADLREAITQLGLQFRLMTQYTSFVAVEEKIVTDGGEPQRVDVATEAVDNGNLQVGVTTETVNVSAGGAQLVETTTAQLSKSFNERQVADLAQTNVGGGVNNLSLLAPNVASSGGVGAGTGGSVGGQRPRTNGFTIDGVDNNDKAATGPQVYVSPENVAEFSFVQNQFSAEFGRSTGGQFLTITKTGTNDYHGSFYGFFRNRYLNALDNAQKLASVVRENPPSTGEMFMPRYDFFRGGVNLGGPVIVQTFGPGARQFYDGHDKLFFYTAYERLQQGAAASHVGINAPTAQGFMTLNAIPGLSPTNLAVFNLYAPVAPVNDAGEINVNGVSVPIGNVAFAAPSFLKQNNVIANVDYIQSTATTHHFRFNLTNNAAVDTRADLPVFYALQSNKQRLFSYGLFQTFTSNLANELRLAYRRSEVRTPAPDISFPGLEVFPHIGLSELGIGLGPNPLAPQALIENNYQILDNVTYLAGNHSLKVGGDFRHIISPQRYAGRERGRYDYSTADLFLRDLSPDLAGERSSTTDGLTYYGNQNLFYAFVQDDWRVKANLTLNMGLGYSYQQMPDGAGWQALNSISSVPGLIQFDAPGTQKRNFAPKLGLAYSPNFTRGLLGRVFGSNGESSVRAGFSLGYDYIFDQFYSSSQPPQLAQTRSIPTLVTQTPNFLGSGAVTNLFVPVEDNAAAARRATSSFIPDQEVPYSLTWTLSLQRQFMTNWSVELRYLGTRGVHLLTQNRINRIGKVGVAGRAGLPTFLSAPSQLDALAAQLTLADINARSNYVQGFDDAGFNGANVTAFLSNGSSIYHGAAALLRRRFSNGFELSAAYTLSHLMDDSTAEAFSTSLSPHRVEEFQDLRRERADSALDRRHRFVVSAIYELPFFRNNPGGLRGFLLGGFNFTGTWSLESGERATVLSGIDANLNADTAGDRTIRNPDGVRNTASIVIPLLATCTALNLDGTCAQSNASRTVGYLAVNPAAEYIQAGPGAVSNSARNTLLLPGINNVDFSVFKNFRFGEDRRVQLRADFFNLFNHAQYIPGSVNEVSAVSTTGVQNLNTVGRAEFYRPDLIFSSNPRVIQIALRFDF